MLADMTETANALFGSEPSGFDEGSGSSNVKTDMVTSSEMGDALVPQLSMVYDELKADEGVEVELELDIAEEVKVGVAVVGVAHNAGEGGAEVGAAGEVAVSEDVVKGIVGGSDKMEVGMANEGNVGVVNGTDNVGVATEEGHLPLILEEEGEMAAETTTTNSGEEGGEVKGVESNTQARVEEMHKGMDKGAESKTEGVELDSGEVDHETELLRAKLEEVQAQMQKASQQPPAKKITLASYGFVNRPIPPLPPRGVAVSKRLGLYRRVAKVAKLTSEEADLVELVRKILSVSEEVEVVVRRLKREVGHYSRQASSSTPLTETPQEAAYAYVKAMKPLQFGEW